MTSSPSRSLLAQRRISRRRLLAGASAAVVAAGLLATACSGRRRSDVRAGGTLRIATTVPIAEGLDPHIETGTGLRIFPRIYGYTHHVDVRDDSLRLAHAEGIEQPDGATIIIRLRDDVRFHEVAPTGGRFVTSADVAGSIERYRDNPLVTTKTWHTTILDRIETPDAKTVIVRTRQPYAYSLHELGALTGGVILPREFTSTHTDLTMVAAGSGPFSLDAASDRRDVRIVRFGDYFAAPLPYLDAMEWTIVDTEEEKLDAFTAGRADEVPNRNRAEQEQIARSDATIQKSALPALGCLSLGMRVDRPPFNDPRIREAVDMALDRDELIRDILQGDGDILGPVNSHLAGGYWSLERRELIDAQRAADGAEARRAAARSIIAPSGAGFGTVGLQVASRPELIDVATLVRDQLGRVGLSVRLDVLDELRWYANYRAGKFDATLIPQPPSEWPDAPTRLYHSRGLDGAVSPFGFADPAIDWLVTRSWGETDREQRRETLLEAQRLMLAARPVLQLFTTTAYAIASRDVRNWHPELGASLAQYNYEQWLDRR